MPSSGSWWGSGGWWLSCWRRGLRRLPWSCAVICRRPCRSPRPAASTPTAHRVEQYSFGEVAVDFRKAEVTRSGEPVELSAREFQLLRYFVEHRGDVLSRDELLNEVWRYDATPSTRTVDVHVAWLRQKIEENPRHPEYIRTVHGMGYKFVA